MWFSALNLKISPWTHSKWGKILNIPSFYVSANNCWSKQAIIPRCCCRCCRCYCWCWSAFEVEEFLITIASIWISWHYTSILWDENCPLKNKWLGVKRYPNTEVISHVSKEVQWVFMSFNASIGCRIRNGPLCFQSSTYELFYMCRTPWVNRCGICYGQSYKASTIVIYESRVVNMSN